MTVRLEALMPGSQVHGLGSDGSSVTVEKVEFYGSDSARVIFRDVGGAIRERLLYRADEGSLQLLEAGLPWTFDGDGDLLRLASEAYRIRLGHLFDPYLAVETSLIRPLPHQITAVYSSTWSFRSRSPT